MRIKWIKLCRWMLGIMGISASVCSCMKVEYGCPNMNYSVKGRVVDSMTGAGVAGIEVSHSPWKSEADTTGADGLFSISGDDLPCNSFDMVLRDINPDRGGRYKTDTVFVELTKVGEGSGHWYYGEYEARDVVLRIEER